MGTMTFECQSKAYGSITIKTVTFIFQNTNIIDVNPTESTKQEIICCITLAGQMNFNSFKNLIPFICGLNNAVTKIINKTYQ